jgi:hypothetical protein
MALILDQIHFPGAYLGRFLKEREPMGLLEIK